MNVSLVPSAAEYFSCTPLYLRVISGHKPSLLRIFFSDEYVCRQEGNHNLLQPSRCTIKPCLAVILVSCTCLPTLHKWNFVTHKIFAKSQTTLRTVFHFISLVANLLYCSSRFGTRILLSELFLCLHLRVLGFLQKNPEIHWLKIFLFR